MQYTSILVKLAAAAVMVASVSADCSPTHPLGDDCPSTSEGAYFCTPDCTDIVSLIQNAITYTSTWLGREPTREIHQN